MLAGMGVIAAGSLFRMFDLMSLCVVCVFCAHFKKISACLSVVFFAFTAR